MLEQPLLYAQGSSFLIRPASSNTVSPDNLRTLPLTVQYLCNLHDAMSRCWSPSTSYPNLPRKAGDFLRGDKYPNDVPLPTLLAYLQPV